MSFGSVMLATALANLLVALAFVGAGALAASLDPLFAAVAATFLFASAWGLWLLGDWQTDHDAMTLLTTRLGGVMGAPPAVLILLTLVLAAVLAWSAAALAAGIATTIVPRSGDPR